MAVGDDEIDLGRSARSHVLEHTEPPVFALLGAGSQRQHLFVSGQVHSQRCEDERRIGLVPMTHAEMDPIQVEDTPMRLQRAFAPGGELLLQIAIKPTDGTGTSIIRLFAEWRNGNGSTSRMEGRWNDTYSA